MTGKQLQRRLKLSEFSIGEIAEKLKVSRDTLYQQFKRDEVLEYYIERLTELDILPSTTSTSDEVIHYEEEFMQIPILSISVQADYVRGHADIDERTFHKMLVSKEYEKGHYLIVEVRGDSMDDSSSRALMESDKLLVKELDQSFWKEHLYLQRHVWVIVHRDGILFKQILDHNAAKGIISCHSWNPMIKDSEIKTKDIYRLFYVKKLVERRIQF